MTSTFDLMVESGRTFWQWQLPSKTKQLAWRGIIGLWCGTSQQGTRFNNMGDNKRGKHSIQNSFQAYNVVHCIVKLIVSTKPIINRNHCWKPIPHIKRYCREVERDGDNWLWNPWLEIHHWTDEQRGKALLKKSNPSLQCHWNHWWSPQEARLMKTSLQHRVDIGTSKNGCWELG